MNADQSETRIRPLLAALLFSLAGCSGMLTRGDSYDYNKYLTDTTLAYNVKTALLADPEINELRTWVEAFNGEVQLTGFANTAAQAQKVEQVARGVRGVKSVRNTIALK